VIVVPGRQEAAERGWNRPDGATVRVLQPWRPFGRTLILV
jgi:hypothetical protein